MQTVLQTQRVTKYYSDPDHGIPVLNEVDLNIRAGQFTILMGASGSGKSTLLHLLGGLDLPSSGAVYVDGTNTSDLNESQLAKFRRQHIGYVFQNQNLLHQLTLEENILLAGYLVSKDKKAVRNHARLLLEQMDISALADRLPGEVSGGESQRCAIARALINKPKILLADEPTGNLNSKASTSVLECFRALHQAGQSILMVTHDMNAASWGNEIFYLQDGVILDYLKMENTLDPGSKYESIKEWLVKIGW